MTSLRDRLGRAGGLPGCTLSDLRFSVGLGQIAEGTSLGGRLDELRGRAVLVATGDQLTTALALIELDGVARRIVVCPPDLAQGHLAPVLTEAEVDAVVCEEGGDRFAAAGVRLAVACRLPIASAGKIPASEHRTEWVLLTSGTTGAPKMVMHSLAGLTAAIKPIGPRDRPIVWGTFYDIRRYGGLQILLRALLAPGSLVLSSAGEPAADHLRRLGALGVTHISGTASHWRRALMCAAAGAISPEYIRLSGEIADQPILDSLHQLYPHAAIGHAYASTEAGVGFEVNDGLEGFPARLLDEGAGDVQMKVENSSLRIRSPRTASRYLGSAASVLVDSDGFVDTGDMVERRDDRYHFVGRRGGIINVGGLKVHPEEVEAVINRHESVRMSLVKSRRSPIIGAIVVADVVLNEEASARVGGPGGEALRTEILRLCRDTLPVHKVPASIRFVPTLDVTTGGKLARHDA
ncbi:MAG: long-chain fatty acid--CoA ligase [Methylobacteriaceae bacterium]|nr:long-chain fatty acid--CoA ligase [Methylobacteriaceae bacterium]